MAQLYPYDMSADALLRPAKNARFFEAWQPADTTNHDLLCAEFSRLAYAEESVVRAALTDIGFEAIAFLGGETEEVRRAYRGTQGFVARHAGLGLTVLAFRGTESGKYEDLISDLSTLPVVRPDGCRVHSGFWKAYLPVKAQLATLLAGASGTVLITGHSLGAALATLAAADLAPTKLITFGSPRVGDRAFGDLFAASAARPALAVHRYVDCCDVVARVPPPAFDEVNLTTLLSELGDFDRLSAPLRTAAHFAVGLAAKALAQPFARLTPPVAFEHIGPARYLDRAGVLSDAPAPDAEKADQAAARAAYPHSAQKSFEELASLLRSLAHADRPSTPRDFLHALFGLVRGEHIPLRDLADHAPINYFSGLAGRRPA